MSPVEIEVCKTHSRLSQHIHQSLSDYSGAASKQIEAYFATRSAKTGSMQQDLLPLLIASCLSDVSAEKLIPLAAAWSLNLASAHFFDTSQDEQQQACMLAGVAAMGAANVAMAQLPADLDTRNDILAAIGQVTLIGANAQIAEWEQARSWNKHAYHAALVGKAGALIAVGCWIGGRYVSATAETLKILKEFGLSLGTTLQLSDDCIDLKEDLSRHLRTLPLHKGLEMVSHEKHSLLQQLVHAKIWNAQQIFDTLNEMGALAECHKTIRAFQLQTAAFFKLIPSLERYFADYVAPAT